MARLPGSKPDVTQFPDMITQLKTRYEQVCAAAGTSAQGADLTVVFDAGQNSDANFAHLAQAGLSYVGSVPASDCPDLLALPASDRTLVGKDRFGGLTAYDTRRDIYGAGRRAILTHSPELHDSQALGFDGTTLARPARSWTSWQPPWPAARPAAGKRKSPQRSSRSPPSPGPAASSPGN